MALPYVIKARARREIERLAEWWALNRQAAPGAVRLDLNDVLAILTKQPGIGHKVETGRPIQVRRFLVSSRTQHWIYFREKNQTLEVLCIWATSRGTEPKL